MIYLVSQDGCSDYQIHALMEGPDGFDLASLYSELTKPIRETMTIAKRRPSYEVYAAAKGKLLAEFNGKGYQGETEAEIFLSVLVKDHGFRKVEWEEFNIY